MNKPEALALADRIENATANVDLEGIVRIQISSYDLDHASSELRRLHYENEALRKDAERYRLLRSKMAGVVPMVRVLKMNRGAYTAIKPEELDDAMKVRA